MITEHGARVIRLSRSRSQQYQANASAEASAGAMDRVFNFHVFSYFCINESVPHNRILFFLYASRRRFAKGSAAPVFNRWAIQRKGIVVSCHTLTPWRSLH